MIWGKKKNKGYSYLGANITLEGRLCFSGSVDLVGRVNGDVISDGTLVVMDKAVITGNILVENLVVSGIVYGNIKASKHVQLNASSKVYGHISYGELSQEGAHHDGSSHKLTEEEIEKTRQECRAILEESATIAAKSLPNEAALEQFSSLMAVRAEKQANAILGRKQDSAAPAKKPHGHHQGKSSAAGGTGGPAASPRKIAPGSGEVPRKAEAGRELAKAAGNSGPAAKADAPKQGEAVKKTFVPPKSQVLQNEAAAPAETAAPAAQAEEASLTPVKGPAA